jgi:hypothetical protein
VKLVQSHLLVVIHPFLHPEIVSILVD